MKELKKISKDKSTGKDRQWTLQIMGEDHAMLFWQSINPNTGEGWQARRDVKPFFGNNAEVIARFEFVKADMRR